LDDIVIRPAGPDDAKAIASIHVHAWQAAYQGLVPSAFLDSLSVEDREAIWRQRLERRTSEMWVADEGGKVVGWVSAGRSRDADALSSTGEVWAIYVSPLRWRRGVGRHLWSEAEGFLGTAGFSDVTLWVLQRNAPAIAFYESIGLALDPGSEKTIALGGAELLEVRLRKRCTLSPGPLRSRC
jgi:ribosomal protein S18 acetylase RimI-like enzyme